MKKLFALLLVLSLVLALSVQAASAEEGVPTVYFTADISPEGLQRVYDALNWTPAGNPAEPDIHDIGILASTDPVALDQACIDLVWQAEGNESLVRRIESRDGLHTLEYAAEIGLGSRTYDLVNLDD